MTDLFLSYSRRDQAFVRELHAKLEKVGKDAWVDWENIPLTAEWLKEIYDGIEAADAFAYVITPDSVRSEVCSLELAHAISHNKRLMPILRRELVEDMDKKALDPKISSHNWIYFREMDDFDKAFNSLTDALDTDLDYLKAHTRLLIKAVEWNDKERDAGLVLRGNDLRIAGQWLQQSAEKQPQPTDLQREYIQSSQRAATARIRALTLYAVYGIVVILLAGFAFLQALSAEDRRQEADEQRHVAEDNAAAAQAAKATAVYNGDQAQSLALASNAQQILYRDKNPELALALSLIANTAIEQPPILAQGALAQAAYFPGTRYILDQGTEEASRIATDPAQKRVLFVNHDNALILMNVDTQEVLQTWPSADASDTIRSVALTSDGKYAAASYGSGKIHIYNTEDGTSLKEFGDETSGTLWDSTFSPDGKYLVTACGDGRARVWDWRTGTQTLTFSGHVEESEARGVLAPSLWGVAVRPDSKAVLTIDDSLGILMLWDITTGERLQTFEANVGAGRAVAFLPDGQTVLAGYDDNIMRMIDLETQTVKREFVGHTLFIWDITVTDNGREAISSSYDNGIIHWDLYTGEILESFKGHNSIVYGVAMVGNRFISASGDGTLRYWDLANGAQINQTSSETADYQIATLPQQDGQESVAFVTNNGTITIVDDANDLTQYKTIPSEHPSKAMGIDQDHNLLVAASNSDEGLAVVYELDNQTKRAEKSFGFAINGVDIHPDGEWIAVVGDSADIVLWNWKTDEERHIPTATAEEIKGQDPRIRPVKFTPDGTQIVVGGISGISNSALLFDVASGKLVREYKGHQGLIYSIDISPDGQFLATGSGDDTMFLWRLDQTTPLRSFYGHTDDVLTVRFSPNGRLLASAGVDNTVRLWDINTGSEIQRFDLKNFGRAVAFDSQSNTIFTGDEDGNLQHWQIRDLPSLLQWVKDNRYVPPLTCEQRALYQVSQEDCKS